MVLILGVVQNVQRNGLLEKSWEAMEEWLAIDPDSEVALYEDYSTDGTSSLIKRLAHRAYTERPYPRASTREERIAYARNRLLDLEKDAIERHDLVLWIDLDGQIWNSGDIPRVIQEMKERQADAVFVHDVWKDNLYYDRYALRSQALGCCSEPDLEHDDDIGKYFGSLPEDVRISGTEWVPVESAFGGMGFFRSEVFRQGCRFDARPSAALIERVTGRTMMHPHSLNCEHVGLGYDMIVRGFDKMFIDPQWVYYRARNELPEQDKAPKKQRNKRKKRTRTRTLAIAYLAIVLLLMTLMHCLG